MGYVFTPRELLESRIPNILGYQNAMQSLRQGLLGLSNRRIIYGANIHGSNFHTDGGIGSDVDVLVIYDSPEAEEYLRGLHALIRESTYVPVEFVPVPKHMAERGHHQLDCFYVRYIQTFCQDGVVGNNPLVVVSPKDSWRDPSKEVADRLEAQLTKFSKQRATLPAEYNEGHCDFLEKVIRQPIYSAIDMLRIVRGNYPAKDGRPLSKTECCELYAQEFPQLVTPDLFLVLERRNKYRQFLREWKGEDLAGYVRLLEEIDDIYPNARRVIEINFEFLLEHSPTFS